MTGAVAAGLVLGRGESAAAEEERKGKQESTVGPQGASQPVAVDLMRLGAALDLYSAEAQRRRLATAITGVGIGSAMVPSGLVLMGRTDGVSRALVIGMVIGGSAQVLSVPFLFIPTRLDAIHDKFLNRPVNVESKATIRAIETEWREAAEASRRKRSYVGTTLLVTGSLNLAGGLTCLLAQEGIFGMSRKAQYVMGGVLMGIGAPVTTLGVRMLFEWSLEESSWQAYRTMKSDAGLLARSRSPTLSITPMAGGMFGSASLSF